MQVRAPSRAEDVDDSYYCNHQYRDTFRQKRCQWHNFSKVSTECDRERRDCAAADDEEKCPAEEEGRESAEAIANVNVKATSRRFQCREFAVGERAEETEHASYQPDQEGRYDEPVYLPKHRARNEKDPGSDD